MARRANVTTPAGTSTGLSGGPFRTHYGGELRAEHVGRRVRLAGWVHRRRDLGGVIFIDLRDREGQVQVVIRPEEAGAYRAANQARSEDVVVVEGEIKLRPPGTENARLATGAVEVHVTQLEVIAPAQTPPFPITDEQPVDESLRLRFRYLDLRRPHMIGNLRLRHRLALSIRTALDRRGFLEVETPMLIKSTPEGARDFLVPSRLAPGRFYVLPQSPQLFKQILMVAGFDKYFQIVRCFRDEDLRADRQPEFTQVDLEMSFTDEAQVQEVTESVLADALRESMGLKIARPFPRLTYAEAMARYGTDKPDFRFGMEIVDVTDIASGARVGAFDSAIASQGVVRGFVVPGAAGYSRSQLDALVARAREAGLGGLATVALTPDGMKGSLAKQISDDLARRLGERLGATGGDLLVFGWGRSDVVSAALGRLRVVEASRAGLIPADLLSFCWVTEFPLLERTEGGGLGPMHHPFTSPVEGDRALLDRDPLSVRARAYDLVVNGVEVGGGSIRISDAQLQRQIFRIIGLSEEEARDRFGFLLEAFRYGVPPHGGIALGFDRLVMVLAREETIREVMAFPKTATGADLMTGAPSEVDPRQLREAHITIITE